MSQTVSDSSPEDGAVSQDFFDPILNLEDQYHREGYEQGLVDGARGGRAEGHTFGLEKGFEKFVDMGRLQGLAEVWEGRLPPPRSTSRSSMSGATGGQDVEQRVPLKLPMLDGGDRLRRHIERLVALTDPATFSTHNSDEGVGEFDDRLKDAKAKAMVIEKLLGESADASSLDPSPSSGAEASGSKTLRVRQDNSKASGGAKGGDVEDFVLPKHLQ